MTITLSVNKLTDLLKYENIVQIICIDDYYNPLPSLDDIVEVAMANQDDIVSLLLSLAHMLTRENPDIMREEIRDWARKLNDDERRQYYQKLTDNQYTKDDISSVAASELDAFLHGLDFQKMTPNQWLKERDGLLNAIDSPRALLIFDEQLGNGLSGLEQIKYVLATNKSCNFMCCLLSHTIIPDGERTAWDDLSTEHGISKSDFFPISKQRLSTKDYEGFSRGIKHSVLNSKISSLRDEAMHIIESADEHALNCIEKMDMLDIERVVFLSSEQEGVWELDTFFRLFGLFHRMESRKNSRKNTELQSVIDHVRAVNTIIPPVNYETNACLAEIQRQEIYEDADFINGNHFPLDLGDIFTVGTEEKKFILLAQPCDLMLRDGGARHKSVYEVILVEIDKVPSTPPVPNETERLMFMELPYFKNDNKHWAVLLRKTHVVPLTVLDLCVFQPNGASKMSVFDGLCPSGTLPSWKKRHAALLKEWLEVYKTAEMMASKGVDQDLLNATLFRFSFDGLINGIISTEDQTITINCRRTGRLCRPRAEALLSRYASFISRAGFEHDLDREIRLPGQERCQR